MFRSKTAEAYFNQINKNKDITASSAGIIRGYYPLNKRNVAITKEFGINITGRPQGLSVDMLREQNIVRINRHISGSLYGGGHMR